MSEGHTERAPEQLAAAPPAAGERELKSVIGDLWGHSETLVRQEIALLKAEYESRVGHAKVALRRGLISAGLFHAAYLTTLATLVLVLAQWLEPWLASLLVALCAISGALAFTWLGKQALEDATEPAPPSPSLRRQRAPSRSHS